MKKNNVLVRGRICSEIVFNNEVKIESQNVKMYKFYISLKRLSGTEDVIPVIASEYLLETFEFENDSNIEIRGEFRSHNKDINGKRKLELFVYAKEIENVEEEKNINEITLIGFLCKPPVYRETPFGRRITDLVIAVNRYQHNKSDYIPVITWGISAKFANTLEIGDKVYIKGRIQSRRYLKNEEEHTAYEISTQFIKKLDM